jgi:HPt (histidine-containing phosphotransfer) domain-containing protein
VVVFDRTGLMARVLEDEDLARTVVQGFLDDAPSLIEALKDALRAGDESGAIRQAHTIKGASATVGGEALSAVAQEMETAATAGDLAQAGERLPDLESEFGRLRTAMGVLAG